jgi:hypothetical protein
MSIANGQTVLKIGETVLTSLPLHHQSTSIKHRRIHHHFHRFKKKNVPVYINARKDKKSKNPQKAATGYKY